MVRKERKINVVDLSAKLTWKFSVLIDCFKDITQEVSADFINLQT